MDAARRVWSARDPSTVELSIRPALVSILLAGCGSSEELAARGGTDDASGSSGSSSSGAGSGGAGGTTTGPTGSGGGGPRPEPDCHPQEQSSVRGAYFRKVISDHDEQHRSIHVRGVLPEVILDLGRWFSTDDPGLGYQTGPLDRPSVYLGGRAGDVEVDAGLTWDRVYHTDGRPTFTDQLDAASDGGDPARRFVIEPDGSVESVDGEPRPEGLDGLIENFAFRAFWRAEGVWHNPGVGSEQNHYFYPGEGFRMQVGATAPGQVSLFVNHGLDAGPDGVHATFAVSGWGVGGAHTLKRVNSIDQFTVIDGERIGLETAGLEVLDTETIVSGMRWEEVRVLGSGGTVLAYLDCSAKAIVGADEIFQTSYDAIFRFYEQTSVGGETNDIVPSAR